MLQVLTPRTSRLVYESTSRATIEMKIVDNDILVAR